MARPTAITAEHLRSARFGRGGAGGRRLGLCLGMLLALGANQACAEAVGSVASSVGLLAALAALFVVKGWPAHLPVSALSTAGTLAVAGGAAWLWRVRGSGRVASIAGTAPPAGCGAGLLARCGAARPISLPAGFEHEALLADFRGCFVRLQHAWDHAETAALSELTTPEMLRELERESPGATTALRGQRSEIVTLGADLLGFETWTDVFVASVEFSGLIREGDEGGAVPFRELWLLTRARQGSPVWRLARHQALL